VLLDAEKYEENHVLSRPFRKIEHVLSDFLSSPTRFISNLKDKSYNNYITRELEIGKILDGKFIEELDRYQ